MSLPGVSVIISAFSPKAKPYLDACVKSVRAQDYSGEIETLIVSPQSYAPQYSGCKTISPHGEDYPLAHNINAGARAADPRSEYFFFINDDCILTSGCLRDLMSALFHMPQVGLLMPISNDQNLGAYSLLTAPQGPYTLESVSVDSLIERTSVYPPGLVMRDTLCLFAFLIRREVFAKVGDWDEHLLGMDDVDYSWRMRGAGYLNAIELSALCFHAGGVTTSSKSDAWRAESARIFNEKWANK